MTATLSPETLATAPLALALALTMVLAWAWDARWGKPRNAWHPVAWLGQVLGPLGRRLLPLPAPAAFVGGALAMPPDAQGDLAPARLRLARLVSRDVSAMDASELRETALQTLSENLNDSVVAPLFWFALLGLAPLRAWPALPGQARLTPSPNGGWAMGALALRLGVRLRKPGLYTLNAGALSPDDAAFGTALRCTAAVAWSAAALAAAVWALRALEAAL